MQPANTVQPLVLYVVLKPAHEGLPWFPDVSFERVGDPKVVYYFNDSDMSKPTLVGCAAVPADDVARLRVGGLDPHAGCEAPTEEALGPEAWNDWALYV